MFDLLVIELKFLQIVLFFMGFVDAASMAWLSDITVEADRWNVGTGWSVVERAVRAGCCLRRAGINLPASVPRPLLIPNLYSNNLSEFDFAANFIICGDQ